MQLNANAHAISARQIIEPGLENAILRYEVVKRGDKYLCELIKHWVTNYHNGAGTVTESHRAVVAEIDLCMHQNTPEAARPTSVGGIVARVKELSTRTGIPMTVNLPQN